MPLDPRKWAGHLTEAMNDSGPDSLIPYDEIVQEALRAVVGRVLGEIVTSGGNLPGNHHFYITFKTGAPGVSIPTHLRERFPDEMTIVLQNKFWDLAVDTESFSVGLTFNQVPAKLTIPFAAIPEIEPEAHEQAENDVPEPKGAEAVSPSKSSSNVVSVDFGRKK
jgi:hypothetical protein